MVTSPLVQRLLAKISQSSDAESRACYIAELACYRARVGEFDEAERLRTELRRTFGDGRSVRVSVLIMCIEALLSYFHELSPNARDRMARANILSNAAKDRRLIAFTSAWMAHIDFNLCRFESMAAAIATCLSAIDSDDGTAECRVSLVLGDAFLYVGALSTANAWYGRARVAANSIGDQAAIGALTYNRAALRVAGARFQRLSGTLSQAELGLLRGEVDSAFNYQAIAQLRSLDHLLQTARVGTLILHDRFIEAEPLIADVLRSPEVPRNSAQRSLLKADLALCLARNARHIEAMSIVDSLRDSSLDDFSPDDRALIWSSIARASEMCGVIDCLARYESAIKSDIAKHSESISALAKLISPFEQPRASA